MDQKQTLQRSMVNKPVSRRVKSKVELQLEREKKEEEMRIKKQKHMAWLQYQSRCKAAAAMATASAKVRIAAPVAASVAASKITRITTSPATIKNKSQHVVLEVYVPCKALNNSWADQTEFEDLRKCMLMRMVIKKLKQQ